MVPCWPQFEGIETKLDPLPFTQVGQTTQRRACSHFCPPNHILTVNNPLCSGSVKVKFMPMYSFITLANGDRRLCVRCQGASHTNICRTCPTISCTDSTTHRQMSFPLLHNVSRGYKIVFSRAGGELQQETALGNRRNHPGSQEFHRGAELVGNHGCSTGCGR